MVRSGLADRSCSSPSAAALTEAVSTAFIAYLESGLVKNSDLQTGGCLRIVTGGSLRFRLAHPSRVGQRSRATGSSAARERTSCRLKQRHIRLARKLRLLFRPPPAPWLAVAALASRSRSSFAPS